MSVVAADAGGPRGSISSFTVSMDDSLHCVQAAGTNHDCVPFSIIVWVLPYSDMGAKIRCPDFQISINIIPRYTSTSVAACRGRAHHEHVVSSLPTALPSPLLCRLWYSRWSCASSV